MPHVDPENHSRLTQREREVAALLLDASPLGEIANQLNIALSTVRAHVQSMRLKTSSSSLVALALWVALHWNCCLAEPTSAEH